MNLLIRALENMHYIKDHIGNVCAVVNSAVDTTVQSTIYYPSGVPMAKSLGRNVSASQYNAMGIQETMNFGLDEQPYLYNGKEYITAHDLNEYDSQARRYYASIMRTTTIDPYAELYYHISPYAWCGNNPISNVDITGKKYKVVTKNNTKTVKATIYTNPRSYKSAKKAADFWSNKKGFKYTSSKGKTYGVEFDIKVVKKDKEGEALRNEANDDSSGNSYEITNDLGKTKKTPGRKAVGSTDERTRSHIKVLPEREDEDTGAHEVGHILGLDHSEEGIMTETCNDPNRSDDVSQDEVDQIIESDQERHPVKTKIESFVESMQSILRGGNQDEKK